MKRVFKLWDDMRIRTKIVATMAVVLVLMAGLGATAVLRLEEVDAVVTDVNENDVKSLGYLDDMRAAAINYRSALNREVAVREDPALVKATELTLKTHLDDLAGAELL